MRCIAVSLDVPDIDAAVAYYRDTLGFEEGLHIPGPDGRPHYATMWNGEATVMFHAHERPAHPVAGVTLYIDVGEEGDVDAYYQALTRRGVRVVKDIADHYWGARAFTIADLNGYHLTFAEQTEVLTPEQMVERMRERS